MASVNEAGGRESRSSSEIMARMTEGQADLTQAADSAQAVMSVMCDPELSALLTYVGADRAYAAFDTAGIRRPVAYAAAWMVSLAASRNREVKPEQLSFDFDALDAMGPDELASWERGLNSAYSGALGLSAEGDPHRFDTNYSRYMDLEQGEDGLWRVVLAVPETLGRTEAAATVESRWETSRERTGNDKVRTALELARSVESLDELETACEVSLVWGSPGWAAKWDMPYADDDPFASASRSRSALEVIATPRFVGEDGLRETMEVVNEGAATRIYESVNHIESDFIALSDWACGGRESPDAIHPEVADILGDALSITEKYQALRTVFSTEWGRGAEQAIRDARSQGITPITRIHPIVIDNRLHVTGISPEAVMKAIFTCVNDGKSSLTFPWYAKVKMGKSRTPIKTENYITVTVPDATASELLSLGRVTVFEALSVGFAFYQVYKAEEETAQESAYIPTPEYLIIKALMATAKGGKAAEKQRSWRRRVHTIIEALRKVDVSYRVYDINRSGYVEVYLKLIDVVAFKDYEDSHGRKVKSWLARKNPIAIFTQKGLGIPKTLPLPDVEAFDDIEAYLWNFINLRLNTLDWMVRENAGALSPVKTLRIERSEIENLGSVPAIEGIKVKTKGGGQPGGTASPKTIRSRKSRTVDAVTERLPKVAKAIIGAREAARTGMSRKAAAQYPVVSIEPEYVKGDRTPRMLNAIVLQGRLPQENASPSDSSK